MRHFLGVDGGGTKTAFVLVDEEARVVASTTGPTCYYLGGDIGLVRQVLEAGIAHLEQASGVPRAAITSAFFALPAYGEVSADVPVLDRIAGEVLGHGSFRCGNDMVAGWAGSLECRDGINVVAGTGSIAYGEWRGRGARAGGWGELFGDEGSGYWTAVRGLALFSQMSDGRRPRTPLHEHLRRALGIGPDLDAIGTVLVDWGGRRDRIAALSRAVLGAADEGDEAALAVVEEAGAHLAALVHAVRASLGIPSAEEVEVSYSGGMFSAPLVLSAFRRAIGPGFLVVPPAHGPELGAALYARKQAAGVAPR